MERLWGDVRYGVRSLWRAPVFAAAALATLALGIGATSAIFSVVNAALLAPPPYPEPQRIFALGSPDARSQDGQIFHYVRDHVRTFERIASHGGSTGWNVVVADRAEYVTGVAVSEGFFDVLGVRPLIGRGFSSVEDRPNGPSAVVVSHRLWRRLFGGRSDVVGESLVVGGVPRTIVGVMPEGFQTTPSADLWTPLRLSPRDNSWNYRIVGRLQADASRSQATAELAAVKPGLSRDLPAVSTERIRTMQWISYQRWLGLGNEGTLLLLLGAVGFVFLIACVNVAALQLVRGVARQREMATRAALGGGRARLVQQVFTESLVLAFAGALLGLVAAKWGLSAFVAFVPAGFLPTHAIELDWRVVGATLGLGVGASVLFGVVSAFGVAQLNVRAALWEGAHGTAGRHTLWLRKGFAVAELGLAVVLLISAGLLVRTFVELRSVEPGFDPADVVIGKMSLQGSRSQTRDDPAAFFEQTIARVRALPGVERAAIGSNVPVENGLNLAMQPPAGALIERPRAVDWRYVTPEYFAVFGVPVRGGRAFDERDGAGAAAVAVVNEAFSKTYFGAAGALGRQVQLMQTYGDPPREIVGVVADVKGRSGSGWTGGINALGSPAAPTLYVPAAQVPQNVFQLVHGFFPISWAVKIRPGSDVAPAIQEVVRTAEPRLPFMRFETMTQVIGRDLEMQRFLMLLVGVFAAAALLLAAVGLYGLVAYSVTQRTIEVGIRMALGATPFRVLSAFLAEMLSLALAGVTMGLAASALSTRLLSSLVFGVTLLDPLTFATVAVLLVVVTLVATLIPAVRAARIDPMRALRT